MGFKDFVIGICRTIGFYPTPLISQTQLDSLMAYLRPIHNGFDLVRVGDTNDGGYLLPTDVENCDVCFSAGVADNWKFEKELFRKYSIPSVMYDGSVEAPPDLTGNQKFIKKFIGAAANDQFVTVSEILNTELLEYNEIVGQIDIEGFEYEVLNSLSIKYLKRFRILVCEFHEVDRWLQKRNFEHNILPLLQNLSLVFDLVHNHPNTVSGRVRFKGENLAKSIELTFHRKELGREFLGFRELPHPLDADNL